MVTVKLAFIIGIAASRARSNHVDENQACENLPRASSKLHLEAALRCTAPDINSVPLVVSPPLLSSHESIMGRTAPKSVARVYADANVKLGPSWYEYGMFCTHSIS